MNINLAKPPSSGQSLGNINEGLSQAEFNQNSNNIYPRNNDSQKENVNKNTSFLIQRSLINPETSSEMPLKPIEGSQNATDPYSSISEPSNPKDRSVKILFIEENKGTDDKRVENSNEDYSIDSFYDKRKPDSKQGGLPEKKDNDKLYQKNNCEEGVNEADNLFIYIKSNASIIDANPNLVCKEDDNINISKERVLKKGADCTVASVFKGYQKAHSLGQGAQGKVLKVIDEHDKIRAIKLYEKNQEKAFLHECNLLVVLNRMGFGGVYIDAIIQTDEYYGIVMKAGDGTLLDFKRFLIKNQFEVSENELVGLLKELYIKYRQNLKNFSICHRDIKPNNIILSYGSQSISLAIIDYGHAVSTLSSEHFKGKFGTPGYIAPHIYANKGENTKLDLELNDLFAIGISVLEIAVPGFVPKPNNKTVVDNALNTLRDKEMFVIAELIEKFICCENSQDIDIPDMPTSNSPYILDSHVIEFWKYLEDSRGNLKDAFKVSSHTKPKNKELIEIISNIPPRSADLPQNKRPPYYELYRLRVVKHLANNNRKKAMKFCEQLLIYEIGMQRLGKKDNVELSDKIYNMLLETIVLPFHALTFSLLGIWYYFKSDKEKAREMFLEGIHQAKDDLSRVILLNNYGYACSDLEELGETKSNKSLEKAYALMITMTPEVFCIVKDWENFDAGKRAKTHILRVDFKDIEGIRRKQEIILLHSNEVSFYGRHFKKTYGNRQNAYSTIFINYCCERANRLITLLAKANKTFFAEIQQFVSDYFNQRELIIELPKYFRVIHYIVKFAKIFLKDKNPPFDKPDLAILYDQAERINKDKKHLNTVFKPQNISNIYNELKHCDLFLLMVGCLYHVKSCYSISAEKRTAKEIIKEAISSIFDITDSCDHMFRISDCDFGYFKHMDTDFLDVNHFKEHPYQIIYGKTTQFLVDYKDLRFKDKDKDCWKNLLLQLDPMKPFTVIEDPQEFLSLPKGTEKMFESLVAIQYSVSTYQQNQHWAPNYFEFDYTTQTESFPQTKRALTACLKLISSKEASMTVIRGWHESFSFITEKLVGLDIFKLNMIFAFGFPDTEKRETTSLCKLISSLKSLQELKITIETSFMTIESIKIIGETLIKLNLKILRLSFRYCVNITDEAILELGDYILKLTGLSHLVLEFLACPKVNKKGIESLAYLKLKPFKPFMNCLPTYCNVNNITVYRY